MPDTATLENEQLRRELEDMRAQLKLTKEAWAKRDTATPIVPPPPRVDPAPKDVSFLSLLHVASSGPAGTWPEAVLKWAADDKAKVNVLKAIKVYEGQGNHQDSYRLIDEVLKAMGGK
jgi:hypothetical protein